MTARDIIELAYLKNGSLAAGEVMTSEDADYGLKTLIMEIKALAAESFMIPYLSELSLSLVPSQAAYSIGPSGTDLVTTRPTSINHAVVRDASNYDHPCQLVDMSTYMRLYTKTSTGRPHMAWYNPTSPNGTLYFYYTPNSSETAILTCHQPLTTPELLTDDMVLPEPYDAMLMWQLAASIDPKNAAQLFFVERDRIRNALRSMNAASRVRAVPLDLANDIFSSGNIYSW